MFITYFLWSGRLQGSRCEYPSHVVQGSLILHIRREMGTKDDEELLLDKEGAAKKAKIEIASPTLVTHIPPPLRRKSLQEESGHPRYQLLQKIPLIPCPCAQRPVQCLVTRSAYLKMAGSRERTLKHLTFRSHHHTTSLSPYLLAVAENPTSSMATHDIPCLPPRMQVMLS